LYPAVEKSPGVYEKKDDQPPAKSEKK